MASAKPRSRMFSPHSLGAAHVAVLGAAALGLGSLGAALPAQPAWEMTAYEGVSHPSDIRELAFGARGRVAEVVVKPGDHVVPGDLVIRLEDAVQQQTTALARAQATDRTQIVAAETSAAFRFNDLAQVREAHGGGGANDRELQDAEYRLAMAELERTAAWSAFEQAGLVLAREEARLAEMSIHSPIQGIVVDVLRRGGEAVDEQTRVVTVIRVDPLWIDVNVRTRDALRLQRGQKASVVWQDIDQAEEGTGRIIFISPAGHAGARQVTVRLEVSNPDGLPAGLHATVRFMPPEADEAVAPAPPESADVAASPRTPARIRAEVVVSGG